MLLKLLLLGNPMLTLGACRSVGAGGSSHQTAVAGNKRKSMSNDPAVKEETKPKRKRDRKRQSNPSQMVESNDTMPNGGASASPVHSSRAAGVVAVSQTGELPSKAPKLEAVGAIPLPAGAAEDCGSTGVQQRQAAAVNGETTPMAESGIGNVPLRGELSTPAIPAAGGGISKLPQVAGEDLAAHDSDMTLKDGSIVEDTQRQAAKLRAKVTDDSVLQCKPGSQVCPRVALAPIVAYQTTHGSFDVGL